MILALDFETGGLDARVHAPITLGVAMMEGDEVLFQKEWIFARMDGDDRKHKRGYELRAMEINGIRLSDLKAGQEESRVLLELDTELSCRRANPSAIVSHNAVFDQQFYEEIVYRCGAWSNAERRFVQHRHILPWPWVCTKRIASYYLELPDYKLDTCIKRFELARSGETHGALEDAILCGKLYNRLTGVMARA